jgi:hypothetical protein
MTTPLNGQIIGQAAIATRALLTRLLDQHQLTFEQSVALRQAATSSRAAPEALASGLRIPAAEAAATVSALVERKLLDPDGHLTPTGTALFTELDAGTAAITSRLYGNLPAADLLIAGRVLAEVTARANDELAQVERTSTTNTPGA